MIHGLTPRLAEAGKIKIGWKVPAETQDGKPYLRPIKLDYFLITTTTRDASGLLILDHHIMNALTGANKASSREEAEAIRKKTKVRELPIVLHSDMVEEVAPSRMALYGGPQKCLCSGDGLVGMRTAHGGELVVPGTNAAPSGPTPCAFAPKNPCAYYKSGNPHLVCKPNTKLACSILVEGASIAGAVYVHRTTSEIAHEQLVGSLAQVQRVVGSVRGVPLWLVVRPVTVRPEGKATTVYVCHVELKAPSIIDIQRHVLESRKMEQAIGGTVPRLALAAIGEEDDEEARDISEEFYPVGDVIDVPTQERKREDAGAKQQAAAQPKGGKGNGLAGRIRGGGKKAQDSEVPPHDPETGEVLEREPGADDPDEVG